MAVLPYRRRRFAQRCHCPTVSSFTVSQLKSVKVHVVRRYRSAGGVGGPNRVAFIRAVQDVHLGHELNTRHRTGPNNVGRQRVVNSVTGHGDLARTSTRTQDPVAR